MAGFTSINVPLAGHTDNSLRNLINLVYSRAGLISRATGGSFEIDKELLDFLDTSGMPGAAEELKTLVNEYNAKVGGIRGILFFEDCVLFTGFNDIQDEAHFAAFFELVSRMNRMALTQKRILAKPTNLENEKYAMHEFLIQLGMNGADFKQFRKILMERLSGSQSFRTPEQAEQAKAQNAIRYRERKAATANLPEK